jgi:hypothetical protein
MESAARAADASRMNLLNIGAQMYGAAGQRLDAAARELVRGAASGVLDAGDAVDVMRASVDGQIAGKVLAAAREMNGTLLDVLA